MAKGKKTKPFDPAEYLHSQEGIAEYLSEAFSTADSAFIAKAIGTVAKARGMTQVAKDTGLTREGLYKSLGADARPEFSTVMKVLDSLDIRLTATPKNAA